MKRISSQTFLAGLVLMLAGCWTPPNAYVQPAGNPGLIQQGLTAESDVENATVVAIDNGERTEFNGVPTLQNAGSSTPPPSGERTLTLREGNRTFTCVLSAKAIKHAAKVKVGDTVEVRLTEMFTVYRLENGRLPGSPNSPTAESLGVNGKIQTVDPSYRLVNIQYLNGPVKSYKFGLDARLQQMQPGDDVVAVPKEITKIDID